MFLTKSQVEIRVNYVTFEALNVRILRINKLAGTTMLLNLVWGNVIGSIKEPAWSRRFEQYTLLVFRSKNVLASLLLFKVYS